MQLIVMNGRVFNLDIRTFNEFVLTKTFMTLYAIFVVFISVMRPSIYDHPAGFTMLAIYWAVSMIAYVAVWNFQFWIFTPPNPRWFPRRVHSVFLHIPPLLILVITSRSFAGYWFEENMWVFPTFWDFLRNAILVAIFELIYFTWMTPNEDEKIVKEEAEPKPKERIVVSVGGSSFYLDDIIYLKSIEHYVEVVAKQNTELPRAVLRDVLEQFGPAQGFQPHRSYWAAKDNILGIVKVDGKPYLEMSNGDRLPISRSRVKDFNEWQRDHGAIALKKKTGH